jgi:hypothetical protein
MKSAITFNASDILFCLAERRLRIRQVLICPAPWRIATSAAECDVRKAKRPRFPEAAASAIRRTWQAHIPERAASLAVHPVPSSGELFIRPSAQGYSG